MSEFNIYCDESCHLEYDNAPSMVIGGIWVPKNKIKSICGDIREIKEKYSLSKDFEIKWTKISSSKLEFYKDLVTYFFNNSDMNFRGLIAPKVNLNHDEFNQDHDEWYYKMYYYTLINILKSESSYNIYIDIKEKKRGGTKAKRLKKILNNATYEFDSDIIKKLQIIDSKDSEIMQVADLLIGALGYLNRDLKNRDVKIELIDYIKKMSGKSLIKSTLQAEEKFNIFYWKGRDSF